MNEKSGDDSGRASPLLRPRDLVIGPGGALILTLFDLTGPNPPKVGDALLYFLAAVTFYLLLAMLINRLFPGSD